MNHPILMLTEQECNITRQVVYNKIRNIEADKDGVHCTLAEYESLIKTYLKLVGLQHKFNLNKNHNGTGQLSFTNR